jgi:hypothetical protein
VVLDTVTVAVGNWETLTGTTSVPTDDGAFELIVDCDGTVGGVNVDDWATSGLMATGSQKYWFNGLPVGISSGGSGKYWFNGLPVQELVAVLPGVVGAVRGHGQLLRAIGCCWLYSSAVAVHGRGQLLRADS